MLYPKTIEQKLSFDTIREILVGKCLSSYGVQQAEAMRFSAAYPFVQHLLKQVKEMMDLLAENASLPLDHIFDLEGAFQKAKTFGTYFLEEELHQLKLSLLTLKKTTEFFSKRKDQYSILFLLFKESVLDETVIRRIEQVLDAEGNMKKNASPELLEISRSISEKESTARRRIQHLYKQAESEGWLASTGITYKDGRMVLPVLSEHKRKIKGITHDASATGQTLFIEPEEVMELNNEIKELQLRQRREIIRILVQLTDALRPSIPSLQACFKTLGVLDFIRAKALLGNELKASIPILKKEAGLNYINAFHPLLFLSHKKENKAVIPLSLSLNREYRICVISGPNAGGKSVSLKTIGLLQYMLQCGLPVCMESHSEAGIFDDIFIDIGDEQSIENDLSTYSSHLKSMKHFVNYSSKRSLFLIDELCSGTDPQFGGPIGEAVLNELNTNQSFGVVTSHFSNIKTFANNTSGVFNASMSFDTATLQPLFQLQTGNPGSSYALEIAQKIGLNRTVLNYAKSKLDRKQQRVEQLLVDLEKERVELTKLKSETLLHETELKRAIDENQRLNKELSQKKRTVLQEAQAQAKALLDEANRTIENVIREIKETKAEKEITIARRNELNEKRKTIEKEIRKEEAETTVTDESIKAGDFVKMAGKTVVGEVVKTDKKKATVAFENLYSIVPLQDLIKVSKPAMTVSRSSIDLSAKATQFNTTIDIRGMRGEDALREIEKFIDDALLLGFEKLKIIHGKGDGILKKLLWNQFRKHPNVASFESESEEFGGTGATLIQLK